MIELKGKIEPCVQIRGEIIGTGPRGYTPQKGIDYWTPAEVEEIVYAPKRAEEARVLAEAARATAEEERQTAELERKKFFSSVEGEITELKTDLVGKLDKPENVAAVGKILKVLSVNNDGTFTCEWADAPAGDVTDVQIYGKSIVDGGVANIPIADNATSGVVKGFPWYGTAVENGRVSLLKPVDEIVNTRREKYPVTLDSIDYAVKSAMCDGKGAVWTDVERIAALLRMGCTVDDNGFVKWGASE